jgi:hypothetical protein
MGFLGEAAAVRTVKGAEKHQFGPLWTTVAV